MAPWVQKIGRALIIAREVKGMSRRELAMAASIARSQLSRYERGALMQLETSAGPEPSSPWSTSLGAGPVPSPALVQLTPNTAPLQSSQP
jgi:hypothetical protein